MQFATINCTSPNKTFHYSYPHSDAYFGIFIIKAYYFEPKAGTFSNIKPDISHWEAKFHNDIGFVTVYRRIYRCKFLTLSSQKQRYI